MDDGERRNAIPMRNRFGPDGRWMQYLADNRECGMRILCNKRRDMFGNEREQCFVADDRGSAASLKLCLFLRDSI